MEYRKDIDGLRAIAVVPVLLFHGNIPGFTGGYVGVDIFFVISGYLITGIIDREAQQGKFSFIEFYERRARRIFPALFAVLAATTIAACILLSRPALLAYSKSLLATTLFGSNILFWMTNRYFDGPAAMRPLLHTWSLAIEEQFYLLFPMVILLAERMRRFKVAVIAGIALISLILSVQFVARPAAFYLLPFRAWELCVGALLAIGALPPIRRRGIAEVAALTGMSLIAWALFTFKASTPFPGANALFPCLGAGLLIHAGAQQQSVMTRVLRFPILVGIGLISYSLYMWHWPAFVLFKYAAHRPSTPIESAWILTGVTLVSILSWRYIERPFRSKTLMSRRTIFRSAAQGMTVAIAASVALMVAKRTPVPMSNVVAATSIAPKTAALAVPNPVHGDTLSPQLRQAASLSPAPVASIPDSVLENTVGEGIQRYRHRICFLEYDQTPDDWDPARCTIAPKAGPAGPLIVLWGDSFAAHYSAGLEALQTQTPFTFLQGNLSTCPPLLDTPSERPFCKEFNDKVLAQIATKHPSLVIISAFWDLEASSAESIHGDPAVMEAKLRATIRRVRAAGVRNILVIGEMPTYGTDIPELRRTKHEHRPMFKPSIEFRFDPVLRRVAAAEGALFFAPQPLLCAQGVCNVTDEVGHLLQWDTDGHLTTQGSTYVVSHFSHSIKSAVAQ